jgi:ketosteroid isomerase-like protein
MKSCPTCERTYPDDSLNFCLKDGTPLAPLPANETTALSEPPHDPEATLVAPAPRRDSTTPPPPADFYHSRPTPATPIPTLSSFTPPTTPPHMLPTPVASAHVPTPPPSNRALIVGLTGMVAMLLLALSGVAYWIFLRGNDNQNSNTRVVDNQNRNAPPANNNRAFGNVNANVMANANVSPSPSLTPSPTPSPTLAPENVAAIKEQVAATLKGWAASTRARDIDAHMNYYAEQLDTYYNARNVSARRVEADRDRAFSLYDTMDAQLSNIEITPDPTGVSATAIFDKTWTFEGEEKYSSGSVQQKIWLTKINGRWQITGEKDLQIYYVNK